MRLKSRLLRVIIKTYPICVCAEGSFKEFYLRVCAALSNVSPTYVDSLTAMLIIIQSLLKTLSFITELSKFSSQILSL